MSSHSVRFLIPLFSEQKFSSLISLANFEEHTMNVICLKNDVKTFKVLVTALQILIIIHLNRCKFPCAVLHVNIFMEKKI